MVVRAGKGAGEDLTKAMQGSSCDRVRPACWLAVARSFVYRCSEAPIAQYSTVQEQLEHEPPSKPNALLAAYRCSEARKPARKVDLFKANQARLAIRLIGASIMVESARRKNGREVKHESAPNHRCMREGG